MHRGHSWNILLCITDVGGRRFSSTPSPTAPRHVQVPGTYVKFRFWFGQSDEVCAVHEEDDAVDGGEVVLPHSAGCVTKNTTTRTRASVLSCFTYGRYLHRVIQQPYGHIGASPTHTHTHTHTLCVASKVEGGESHASNRQLLRGWRRKTKQRSTHLKLS